MKIDKQLLEDLYWEEADFEHLPRIKGLPQRPEKTLQAGPHKKQRSEIEDQIDTLREYNFTYKASRHEEWWLLDSLGPFYDEQWFDDVLHIVKGGKEASVYLCQANPSAPANLIAAKVYRPRSLRNLRKDHLYREGRARLDADGLEIVDERMARAIRKGTDYGQRIMHRSWIEHEYLTLQKLHQAGCDVPAPYASDHNAILMGYIGDELLAGPTLNSVSLDPTEARALFERIVHNLELMLAQERVHGDLSAYNILYWAEEIFLIDFPQAINPLKNPNAYAIFQRDVTRICEYFSAQGIATNPEKLATDLWSINRYRTTPNFLWPAEEDQENEDEETPMVNINIRPESKSDYVAIQDVNDQAFNRPEEGRLVETLRQQPEFDPRLSLVAEREGRVIGHALFFPIYIEGEDGEEYPCLSLGPIAVLPKYQKQGIGGMLIEAGHRAALDLDYTAVLLLGHSEYYPRFGYLPAEKWELTNPWQIDGDPWMGIELIKGALECKAGLAVYPEAFNEAT